MQLVVTGTVSGFGIPDLVSQRLVVLLLCFFLLLVNLAVEAISNHFASLGFLESQGAVVGALPSFYRLKSFDQRLVFLDSLQTFHNVSSRTLLKSNSSGC